VSLEALSWAMEARTGSPETKLILLAYANQAKDDGTAWPSTEDISRFAEIGPHSVRGFVQDLIEEGYLRPSLDSPGPGAPHRYSLAMNEETRAAWRAGRA
jgi:hypothetical protein